MVLYGPSPVTATAVAVVKNVACKILQVPQGRVLSRPKSIALPTESRLKSLIQNYHYVKINHSWISDKKLTKK